MLIVFIRAAVLYCILVLTVRLMGKRQIGELQPAELAVTILISNIATLPVEDPEMPLLTGLIPILTLGCLDVLMSWAGMLCGRIRTFMSGRPVIIISGGKIDQQKMKELRFTIDDLMEALRGQGIFDLNEVQFAVAETTGKISVYQKYQNRTVTNSDLKLTDNDSDPPVLAAEDGTLLNDNISAAGISSEQLTDRLKNMNISIDDIYILTVSPADNKSFDINTLIMKENKK